MSTDEREAILARFREDRASLLVDLRTRLAALDDLDGGPHAGVAVVGQELRRARTYIEALAEALERGADEDAFVLALDENEPIRTPRALRYEARFVAAVPFVRVLPDDVHPEEVWIRWDIVPTDLRDDVLSLASFYRDIVIVRKVGRPRKDPS